jgi:hypothetical protein
MPCGARCKEIIDQAYALNQATQCMTASILLNVANGGNGPNREASDEFRQKANELALLAQQIATNTPAGG